MRNKITRLFTLYLFMAVLLCTSAFAVAEDASLWVPVTLEGGTGKVRLASPVELRPDGDGYLAVLHWSSESYDYIIVDGETYHPLSTEGGAVYEIPVPSLDCTVQMQADTVAMSAPHLIDYTLLFGVQAEETHAPTPQLSERVDVPDVLHVTGEMPLQWATGFHVDFCEGGASLITLGDNKQYLLIPEQGSVPDGLPQEIVVLRQPLERIYLAASGVMDMFSACDSVDALRFSALKQCDWYLDEAIGAMQAGQLLFAGKYSAPDYELLYAEGCQLAVENMMISHSPKVTEALRQLGIPVLIDRSSYETTPQGRMEWVKLYGLLTGHSDEAAAALEGQLAAIDAASVQQSDTATVAFFYITSNGLAAIRSASDYIPKLIELSGAAYAFADYGVDASSATMTIQMEDFYAVACNADYLIYNSTITGELSTLADLLTISPIFQHMKAVKEGRVYCTTQNMYQHSMAMGDLASDVRAMLRGDAQMKFLYRLE